MQLAYFVKDISNVSDDIRGLDTIWTRGTGSNSYFADRFGDLTAATRHFNLHGIVVSGGHDARRAVRHVVNYRRREERAKTPRRMPIMFFDHADDPIGPVAAFNQGVDGYIRAGEAQPELATSLLTSLVQRSFGLSGGRVGYETSPDLEIDFRKRTVFLQGEPLKLTNQQYLFAEQIFLQRMASAQSLVDALYGVEEGCTDPDNMLNVRAANLRKALNKVIKGAGRALQNFHGYGYRFDVSVLESLPRLSAAVPAETPPAAFSKLAA